MTMPLYELPSDPDVALITLRGLIEQRLRRLAEAKDIPPRDSPHELLQILRNKEVFGQGVADSLREIVKLGDLAAHGAEISDLPSDFQEKAEGFLEALDRLVSERRSESHSVLSVGSEVAVPWELAQIRGEIRKIDGEGPTAQATVRLQVPGTTNVEDVRFPLGALRPLSEAPASASGA
jgi:hypothetical protein